MLFSNVVCNILLFAFLSSDECEDDVIEIIVEAPEGFRNEDCPPLDADCSSEVMIMIMGLCMYK